MLTLAKAMLLEADKTMAPIRDRRRAITFQYNPENLAISTAAGGGTTAGASASARDGDEAKSPDSSSLGVLTKSLTVATVFDATRSEAGGPSVRDARALTARFEYFLEPAEKGKGVKETGAPFARRPVVFVWGSTHFSGIITSFSETIELFSADGRALRSRVSFGMTHTGPDPLVQTETGAAGTARKVPMPTLSRAKAGKSIQSLFGGGSRDRSWQEVASANGIENPRRLALGQLIDVKAGRSGR